MEYRELVGAFAAAMGVEDVLFDDEGIAQIQADDTELSFMEVPATRQLVMCADVADTPDGGRERFYETLLKANHLGGVTGGATFSISPAGRISLHRTDALVDLDVAKLTKTVEAFLNLVDKWRAAIAAYRSEAPTDSAADGTLPANLGLGAHPGYLSV